jgi:putative flippase GtrA
VRRKDIRELIRFLGIGVIAVAIDFIVYFGILLTGILPSSPAKALSYFSGATVSFVGHRWFVFEATHKHPKQQILPFVLLYGSSLIINNISNELVLSVVDIKLLGWFVSTAVAVLWNYLGMKFVVFKKVSSEL